MLSLPDSYNSLIISLDTHPNKNNFDFVVQRCLNEEARQFANSGVRSSTENTAFQADPKPRRDQKDITCFNCGKKGHYRNARNPRKRNGPPLLRLLRCQMRTLAVMRRKLPGRCCDWGGIPHFLDFFLVLPPMLEGVCWKSELMRAWREFCWVWYSYPRTLVGYDFVYLVHTGI